MDKTQRTLKENTQTYFGEGHDLVPVVNGEYFVLSHEDINYYLVDLGDADWNRLWGIISECEQVENACWTPQEKFSEYLKKCDFLCYAEFEGGIIGFTAMSLMFFRNICLYSNDETMVLREHRKRKLALNLVMLPMEWLFTKTGRFRDITHLVFTSISANPQVVNFYFKNAWTRVLFDCSFKPSLDLMAIKNEYCRRHRIDLVHEDYPFCLKNLFPGSNMFSGNDPRFQFGDRVKGNIPPEFDHMERGDAYAFMLKIPVKAFRAVSFILMSRVFGGDYLKDREIGPFGCRRKEPPRGSGARHGRHAWTVPRVGAVQARNGRNGRGA
jgi:hypothetical protein